MNLGPLELGLVVFAILLLFGYKKLPDASRSLGRSLRIFKGEMRGLKEDDLPGGPSPDHATVVPDGVTDTSASPGWQRPEPLRSTVARTEALG